MNACGNSCILVVEDDAEVSQAVSQMLQHLGYTPVISRDAQEAYELVQTRSFALLLVDYRMPEMTGLDLIFMLRQEGCNVPVIMMSGYLATEERVSGQGLDVCAVLKKPVTAEQLESAIRNAIGLRVVPQSAA